MDFSCSRVIAPHSRIGRVNWSRNFSRILTFLLAMRYLPRFQLTVFFLLSASIDEIRRLATSTWL